MSSMAQLELRTDCPEMQDSLQARLHDPLWLLARQWQFGEFQGDDAGSPAAAQVVVERAPMTRYLPGLWPADPVHAKDRAVEYSPLALPLETMVEREPVSRAGRNSLRLSAEAGLHFFRLLVAQGVGTARAVFQRAFALQPPTEEESTHLDEDSLRFLSVMATRVVNGARLYAKLAALRQSGSLDALFHEAPFSSIPSGDQPRVTQAMITWLQWSDTLFDQAGENPSWVKERLEYAFAVSGQTSAGEVVLTAPEYVEGHLDWSSFLVHPNGTLGASGAVSAETVTFLPAPVSFRGMPAARLWEFEDGRVNFGKVEAQPHDLARLLLVEFALVYSNDWFVVPVEVDVGSLCRIHSLIVTNTFGERMLILHTTAVDGAQSSWRMFALSRDPADLRGGGEENGTAATFDSLFFLPPVLGVTLEGRAIEEVVFLRDEMANMAWAVERVVESPIGRPLDRLEAFQEMRRRYEATPPPHPTTQPQTIASLAYRLGTSVPDYWIPLLAVQAGSSIQLRRGTLPRFQAGAFAGTLDPQGVILDPGRDLVLRDEEVPREGARVTRAYQYARWIDSSTHLWIGRRKQPGRGEGSSGLRFDSVEPQ